MRTFLTLLGAAILLVGGWTARAASEGLRKAASPQPQDPAHYGPILDRHRLILERGLETEMLGPFLFHADTDRFTDGGFRPLYYWEKDKEIDHSEWQFLYPVLSYTRYAREGRLQLGQMLSWSFGLSPQDAISGSQKQTFFPFFFSKRSDQPGENYTAVVPFWGTLKDRFGYREAHFVLFPLYFHTLRSHEVETLYCPWPFLQIPQGKNARGFAFWPFFGWRDQAGDFSRGFFLWPFFLKSDSDLGTDNPRRTRMFLPVYVSVRSNEVSFTSAPWPFWTRIEDKTTHYHEWGFPWPIVAFGHGDQRETHRVWPIYGKRTAPGMERSFLLFPLVQKDTLVTADYEKKRTRSLLIVYSNLRETIKGAPTVRRRVDLWPLFTWARDEEGNIKFQTLSIVAPVLPGNHEIARSYEPLWGLVRWQKSKAGDRSLSVLWNAYRQETRPESKNISLLAGLFQYQRNAEQKQVRLLYFLKFTQRAHL